MAGAGSRFKKNGYKVHKPILPIFSRHTKKNIPMVVEAVKDLPIDVNTSENKIIFIMRDFHFKSNVHREIGSFFPKAEFYEVNSLTDGQASTCLLAQSLIDMEKPLLISACDNGIDVSVSEFKYITEDADAVILVFSNNPTVESHPESFGWVKESRKYVTEDSIKKPISDNPISDYAIVGTFWFKKASYFFEAAKEMIAQNDKINGEYYVDQVFKYLLNKKYKVKPLKVDNYLSWGTPNDYESYQKKYFSEFF